MPDPSHVLLLVSQTGDELILLDALSDGREIEFVKKAASRPAGELMRALDAFRIVKDRDEELFADHVESLVCKPFVKAKVRTHCIEWLKSRAKIEDLAQREREATRVIGEYAYSILRQSPGLWDFSLQSPRAEVRIEVLRV